LPFVFNACIKYSSAFIGQHYCEVLAREIFCCLGFLPVCETIEKQGFRDGFLWNHAQPVVKQRFALTHVTLDSFQGDP
jgi:hypothetical protein